MYSAPLPTGRPSNAYSANKKAAAARAQAARTASNAPVSTTPESFVDSVAWTSPNIESLLHSALHMDNGAAWNSYPQDLASTFSGASFNENAHKGGLCERSTSSLSPPPPPTHNSKVNNESWEDLPFINWPDQSNVDATETCIRQLSDLNVRLYPVYKTSCQFTGGQRMHSKNPPGIKISSSVFETATAFLQGEDNVFEAAQNQSRSTLSEIFRAPATLVDILQKFCSSFPSKQTMPSDSPACTAMDTANDEDIGLMTPPSPTSSASNSFPFKTKSTNGSPGLETKYHDAPPNGGEMSPDSATHHLVLACYIRLLRIYHTLIIALRDDAFELKDVDSGSASMNAELRLFVLAQLITQLLERLRKAVAAYFSMLPSKTESVGMTAQTTSLDTLGMPEVDLDRVTGLESSIQGDLKQLQTMLQS